MSYAIVLISGKQLQVRQDEVIEVTKVAAEKGKTLIFDKVLVFNDGQKTVVGEPYVKDLQVEGEIVEQLKGKKIVVSNLTRIKITKIGALVATPKDKKIVKKVSKKTSK
ncbi:50S ribosomal protein L21 [Candidatus Gottesmanbacteria bacterium]|nr:50S ribosomal protein L21 [Candidatus Gottesmanbacteria bacterium]